ncbi:hypothetical protein D3C72_1733960 [compost metagenome]
MLLTFALRVLADFQSDILDPIGRHLARTEFQVTGIGVKRRKAVDKGHPLKQLARGRSARPYRSAEHHIFSNTEHMRQCRLAIPQLPILIALIHFIGDLQDRDSEHHLSQPRDQQPRQVQ